MINGEIAALAAKNEYVEARLQQAVEIIMIADAWRAFWRTNGVDALNPDWVMEDLRTLLFGSEMHIPCNYGANHRDYFQRALDIVNLPRLLASSSSGVGQGTKHAEWRRTS